MNGSYTRRIWQVFGLFLWTVVVFGLGTITGLALSEKGIPLSLESGNERWRAFVKSHITVDPPKQTLWLRDMRTGREVLLTHLEGAGSRCETILWSQDSGRLGFLLRSSRLLVFDPAAASTVYDGRLAGSEEYPGSRCVRKVEFLPDGRGVRFDLCYRWKVGTISSSQVLF